MYYTILRHYNNNTRNNNNDNKHRSALWDGPGDPSGPCVRLVRTELNTLTTERTAVARSCLHYQSWLSIIACLKRSDITWWQCIDETVNYLNHGEWFFFLFSVAVVLVWHW